MEHHQNLFIESSHPGDKDPDQNHIVLNGLGHGTIIFTFYLICLIFLENCIFVQDHQIISKILNDVC